MTTLTMKEEKRLEIIQRVYRGELTVVEAALILGVSERHCYRIKGRVSELGAKGVVHGNRGRPCRRKIKEKMVKRIVELAKGKYRGFNDRHLTEKLKEQERIELSREKIRRILRFHGIASPRKRRANKHRSRRDRRAAEGMMLQVDGSPHDWLEGRGPALCLIGAIDDASNKVPRAFFEEAESSWAYFRLFSDIFNKHGLAQSVYSDRHSVFWTDREPTLQEQLVNKRPTTEVGRGLEELGVNLILAGSPQAKGRIERLWGTFQDRLVSELRLAGAKNKAEAQAVLERYLAEHNRKFSKPPAQCEPAWRKASLTQIEQALCFKQQRTVAKDNTVSLEGTVFQIPKISPRRSYADKRIDVHVLLDGAVEFFYQKQKIARFDSKITHSFGLYRTNGKREGFRYGPMASLRTCDTEALT
ncbi:MAG TPA: ISNCY family transposase [Methylomirabilota bacterium]|nr:ISNCY family transposase [Methylomirabilota bacterium]